MTPIQIEVLIHYDKSPAKGHDDHKTRGELINLGLLRRGLKTPTNIGTTELGHSHILQMCSLPLPGKITRYPEFKIDYLDIEHPGGQND